MQVEKKWKVAAHPNFKEFREYSLHEFNQTFLANNVPCLIDDALTGWSCLNWIGTFQFGRNSKQVLHFSHISPTQF